MSGSKPVRGRVGERLGRLVLLERIAGTETVHARWTCRCDCGAQVSVAASSLYGRRGKTRSCGCLQRDWARSLNARHGHAGDRRSPEYLSWGSAVQRCFNPNAKAWKDYGGRGISMCDRWRDSFETFLADIGPRPSPAHSLDRYPNNNGHYEPGNCRWATRSEQQRNRRPIASSTTTH